jgi:two-component system sensor histidine kinase/response regulator
VELHGDDLARLRASRVEGETAEAVRLAHALKGVAAVLGADALRNAAARLEAALTGNPSDVEEALHLTALEHDRLVVSLRSTAVAPILETAPSDLSELPTTLAQLEDYLSRSDTRAQTLWRERNELLRAGLGEAYAPLARLLDAFDFEAALVRLRQCNPH